MLFFSILISCECEKFDPTLCESCPYPKTCQAGFCHCDTVDYYPFSKDCLEKHTVTYVNLNQDVPCFASQVILDSAYYDGLEVHYDMKYPIDSVRYFQDRFSGEYFYDVTGDSLSMWSVFSTHQKNGVECYLYLYGKISDDTLKVSAMWREVNNYPNIVDSCQFYLMRDK